jgi:hypothetical protein
MSSFMKIRPVGAELFQADGQIGRQIDRHDELIVAFRNALKNLFTRVL